MIYETNGSLKKMLMTLNNKVIWITGASSGIGKALALQLSNLDCKRQDDQCSIFMFKTINLLI